MSRLTVPSGSRPWPFPQARMSASECAGPRFSWCHPSLIVGKVPAVGVALKDQVPRGMSVLQEKAFQRLADHLPQEGAVRARQFSAVCVVVFALALEMIQHF